MKEQNHFLSITVISILAPNKSKQTQNHYQQYKNNILIFKQQQSDQSLLKKHFFQQIIKLCFSIL